MPTTLTKWEHLAVDAPSDLNALGLEGRQLVNVVVGSDKVYFLSPPSKVEAFYFGRPILRFRSVKFLNMRDSGHSKIDLRSRRQKVALLLEQKADGDS